jgi:hypothetical protein
VSRHLPALALLGWYLLQPPMTGSNAQIDAPLSKWDHLASFDRAESCQEQAEHVFDKSKHAADQRLHGVGPYVRCIASDDPRLAK